jgi:hypothetical protein
MPKLTTTQQRRLATEILSKAKKLWSIKPAKWDSSKGTSMTTKDFMALEAIVIRTLKRIG